MMLVVMELVRYIFCVRNVFDGAATHLKNAYALVFINWIG